MIFCVEFNRPIVSESNLFEKLDAKLVTLEHEDHYEIEINSLEELKALQEKVNEITDSKGMYSFNLLLDFENPPTIYFDNQL